MPERSCFLCGRQIQWCNGSVVAGDLLAYWFGILPGSEIRERCAWCVEAAVLRLEEPDAVTDPGAKAQTYHEFERAIREEPDA